MQIRHSIPFLTDSEIERRASRMLASYQRHCGKKLQEPPIPVEHLVEAHLELRVDWDVIPETSGERILAYIDPVERKICMNETHRAFFDEYFGSEAFTYGHEAGHWELHVIKDG